MVNSSRFGDCPAWSTLVAASAINHTRPTTWARFAQLMLPSYQLQWSRCPLAAGIESGDWPRPAASLRLTLTARSADTFIVHRSIVHVCLVIHRPALIIQRFRAGHRGRKLSAIMGNCLCRACPEFNERSSIFSTNPTILSCRALT
jgi:hypothetical protein